jgi:hypothetical protein
LASLLIFQVGENKMILKMDTISTAFMYYQ